MIRSWRQPQYPRGLAQAGPQIGVVRALAPVVGVCAIPQQAFADLIRANRQDQVVSRYPRFSDLVGYCRLRPTRWAASCCTCSGRPRPSG